MKAKICPGYSDVDGGYQSYTRLFYANVGIQNKYRMKYPIKWGINDNTIAPYFVGNLITQWDIERMPFHDIARFL